MWLPGHFQLTETMRGTHHLVLPELGPPLDREFYFRVQWSGTVKDSLLPSGDRFMIFAASGVLFAADLTVGEVPCAGELRVDYFGTRTIRYDLQFSVRGETYRYQGAKQQVDLLRPLLLIKTHTTCYGAISRADGTIVSRSVVHFAPQELMPFLTSLRLSVAS